MRNLVRLTLIVDVLSILIFVSYLLIFESSGVYSFGYLAFYAFFNILIPLFIGVLIFSSLKKKLPLAKNFATILLQIFVLTITFNFGLIIWSILDVILFNLGFNGLTINAIVKDYNTQFVGYVPLTFIAAILIPNIDYFFSKREEKKKKIEKEKSDRIAEWWEKQS